MKILRISPQLFHNNIDLKNSASDRYNPIQSNSAQDIPFTSIYSTSKLYEAGFKPCNISADNTITSPSNKVIIDSPEKLAALSNSPDMWNKNFVLTRDIDLSDIKDFKPIGTVKKPFRGKFDGNDYVIKGLNIESPDKSNCGLFGVCKSAKLKNINLKDFSLKTKTQSGILCGIAQNCELDNCNILNGKISGLNKIGGLIGLSANNNISNCYSIAAITASKNAAGGLIGYDEYSQLDSNYSNATLRAKEECGGLVGYSNMTNISNSCFIGDVNTVEKAGGLVGWGDFTGINDSYASCSKKSLIGYNSSCTISNSKIINKTGDLDLSLNNQIWYTKDNFLPRLRKVLTLESPEKIFMEDLNFNIKSGNFNIKLPEYSIFERPKHYPENDLLLQSARISQNSNDLHDLFGNLVLKLYNNFEDKQYDEILLEIIKNPYFEPNRKYIIPSNDNFSCTPIFILTTLNRPYLLQECFKRNDLGNVEKLNGWAETGKKTVMERAINHNLLDCVYVMLKAKNQNFDIEKYKSLSRFSSPEIQDLFEKYPNIPDYDTIVPPEAKQVDQISNIRDVLVSVEIPADFEDSQQNTLLNVAPFLEDENIGLQITLNAIHRKFSIEHKNKAGETPLKTALNNNKHNISLNLLKYGADKNTVNNNGENALLVYSQISNEDVANNFIDFCLSNGFNVNSRDAEGNTALINAVNLEHYDVMKNLLQKGCSVNISNNEGQTPLHYACSNQDETAMILLLENFADVFAMNKNGKTPKDYLTEDKLADIYTKYEEMYKYNNIKSDTECNLDLDDCQVRKFTTVQDLIENYDTLEGNQQAAATYNLIRDLKNLQPPMPELKIDFEDNTLLHWACANNTVHSKELIKFLLDSKFDINRQNANGKTPLMFAVENYLYTKNSKEKMTVLGNIKFLLEHNPNLELTDNNGQSVLHDACKTDNSIILNLILSKDPKINSKDILGNTPMNYIESECVRNAMNDYIKKITE